MRSEEGKSGESSAGVAVLPEKRPHEFLIGDGDPGPAGKCPLPQTCCNYVARLPK